uniref:60S ribosome subunit biogenesis protein NIP7 homolog n=2 Tax=Pygocentrus nattereri TaxID=42514 RepID=A0A3B4DBE2_PYGNA
MLSSSTSTVAIFTGARKGKGRDDTAQRPLFLRHSSATLLPRCLCNVFSSLFCSKRFILYSIMRPLTEEETKTMFEKLSKYIGANIKLLVDRPDGTYCFRLHHDRVYYISEKILRLATNMSRDKLVSVGTCFGKFTKTQKFRLHITALDFLAPYAKYKVWVKPGAEQSFLYGNHIMKSGLGRITENTPQYQGVVVYSMADVPLGFGVAAKTTQECRKADPMSIVVFHQADIGEYIRSEDTLT